MVIDKITSLTLSSPNTASKKSSGETDKVERHSGDDKLDITDAVLKVKNAMAASSQKTFVDMKKIEAIRLAIENGEYRINPEMIADKLIRLEKELP